MFCASCGADLNPGATFCPNCGTPQPAQPAAGYTGFPQPGASIPGPAAAAPAVGTYPAAFAAGYATWGSRALGFIVDSLLVGGVMAILWVLLAGLLTGVAGLAGHNAAGGVCCMFLLLFPVATLLVGFYNGVYLIAQRGYSIGQGLVKVKVVDINGNLLTQGTAFIRLLVRAVMGFVPFLPALDLLWPLWDQRGQTLHDKAVNCYVVNNPQGY
ncbi:MAG TPA: RDD family protein [Bryobacteraceae bacterium]|nr:RDD family protein [Bryobacteraceae bacterium]